MNKLTGIKIELMQEDGAYGFTAFAFVDGEPFSGRGTAPDVLRAFDMAMEYLQILERMEK